MTMKAGGGARQGILSLTIKDKSALYAAYMPFVKNGGLFIPTNKSYQLGDEVFMLLSLMGEAEKIPVVSVDPSGRTAAPRFAGPAGGPGLRKVNGSIGCNLKTI